MSCPTVQLKFNVTKSFTVILQVIMFPAQIIVPLPKETSSFDIITEGCISVGKSM